MKAAKNAHYVQRKMNGQCYRYLELLAKHTALRQHHSDARPTLYLTRAPLYADAIDTNEAAAVGTRHPFASGDLLRETHGCIVTFDFETKRFLIATPGATEPYPVASLSDAARILEKWCQYNCHLTICEVHDSTRTETIVAHVRYNNYALLASGGTPLVHWTLLVIGVLFAIFIVFRFRAG